MEMSSTSKVWVETRIVMVIRIELPRIAIAIYVSLK